MGDTVLFLKCVRCGNTYRCVVGDPYMPQCCRSCFSKGLFILLDSPGTMEQRHRRYDRWCHRWQKREATHPTIRVLNEAWEMWEATHG